MNQSLAVKYHHLFRDGMTAFTKVGSGYVDNLLLIYGEVYLTLDLILV